MSEGESSETELERLREENARLRDSLVDFETRFALMLEATKDGVWDWDFTTNECMFSRRWKAILGYEEHEIEGHPEAFFNLLHDADKAKVEAALQAHLERDEPYIVEFRMRAKDGSYRLIEARGQAQRDAEGTPLRIAGVHTDMTERRRRESEQLRNQSMLEFQRETIRALGVPILQVWRGISCLPILGAVDDERANDMTIALLERVASTNTRFAILDLTGADFQADTAHYLGRMTRSLRLIGAQAVLCGISPRMAQQLVEMQLEFDNIATYRDLGDALRACLLELRGS